MNKKVMIMKAKTILSLYTIQTLINQIQLGKLVIPAYQRRFMWSSQQIVNFLDSIYRGFPVGVILALEAPQGTMTELPTNESLFPHSNITEKNLYSSVWYILDGSQRLSVLYNVFYGNRQNFLYYFSLEDEEFTKNKPKGKASNYVQLRSLYSSSGYSNELVEISKADNADMLVETYNQLHAAFRNYEIPIQTLVDMTMDEAMEVYERINVAGRRLRREDIERIRKMNPNE